jgi:hypothetical protein
MTTIQKIATATTAQTKITLSEELRAKISTVATTASESDRKGVAALIAEAQRGEFGSGIKTFTPPMCAIIFLEHNPHNRDWSPFWSAELERRQLAGLWRKNNAAVGFYTDGALADGQNRFAASALAGYTLVTAVVYGLERDAITTIDGGKSRHASDAAKLDGIANSKRKEAIVKTVAAYLAKAGDKVSALRSETEIVRAIETNNVMLEDAIEIGDASARNIASPQLKDTQPQCIAYLMLKGGWPVQRIREKLVLFQTGVSSDDEGESAPFFVAASVLTKARDARSKRDRLSSIKELGIVMYAMQMTEKGVTAIQRAKFKDAVKKDLPSPMYSADEAAMAA